MRVILVLLLSILLLLAACEESLNEPSMSHSTEEVIIPTQQETIEITAEELYKAFDENEIAAERKYNGKLLKITGYISDIGEDILGKPYLLLTGGGEYELCGVQCIFPYGENSLDLLAELKKGDLVKLTGEYSGYLVNVIVDVK